ncbi:MAG: hypothetical protein WC071_09030 [Victivallaceae bacterium]
MNIFDKIPVKLDFETLIGKLKIQQDMPEYAEFRELFNQAETVICPKAIITNTPVVGVIDDHLLLPAGKLNSKILSKKCGQLENIFIFAATCGRELDGIKIADTDFLGAFWLDTIKEEALILAMSFLKKFIQKTYNVEKCVSMCPSDLNVWPLIELKTVYSLLAPDAQKIGIELTEHCYIIPNKSLCGIFFAIDDSFSPCEVCDKQNQCDRQHDIGNNECMI